MAQRIAIRRSLNLCAAARNVKTTSSTTLPSSSRHYSSKVSTPIKINYKTIKSSSHKRNLRSFQTSTPLYDNEKDKDTSSTAPPPAVEGDDDPCPEYQNPLHHKDKSWQKIELSEYEGEEPPEMASLPPLDDGSGKVIAAPHLHELADEIVSLSMLEVKELVDNVAEHFGIEESDEEFGDVDVGEDAGAEEEVKEEKTAFDLKLVAFDAKAKIKVIKEVRGITELGLKEAKAMVEGAPAVVKKDIKMEDAEELKAKLEAVGATVEIL